MHFLYLFLHQDEDAKQSEITELIDKLIDLSRFASVFESYNGLRLSADVRAHKAPVLHGPVGSEGNPRRNLRWWNRPEDLRLNYLESILKCQKDQPLEEDDEWLAIAPPSVLWNCVQLHVAKRSSQDAEPVEQQVVNNFNILSVFDVHKESIEPCVGEPEFQPGVHIWLDNWASPDDGYAQPVDTIVAPRVEYYIESQFSQESASQEIGLEYSHESAARELRERSTKRRLAAGSDSESDFEIESGADDETSSDEDSVSGGEDDSPVKRKRGKKKQWKTPIR